MEKPRSPAPSWQVVVFWILFVVVLLLVGGTALWEQPIYRIFGKALGSMVEGAVVNGGILLAAPLGLVLAVASGVSLRMRSWIPVGTIPGIAGILTGVAGVLIGLFWAFMALSY